MCISHTIMFTRLFLETTDPLRQVPIVKLLPTIAASVLFHTLLYAAFFNLVSWIFVGKGLTWAVNTRLVGSLLVILSLGFAARIYHVQEIHRAYNYDTVRTRKHLDRLYITWIFLS